MKKQLNLFFAFIMLFSAVHSDPVNWSDSPTILSGENVNASDPQIAVDPNGNTVAAWIENNTIYTRTKLVGNDWSPATAISGPGASSAKVVLDNNGNATAIWIEQGMIVAATKPVNADWCCNVTLSSSCSYSPVLAVSSEGDVVAAWVRHGNVETSTKPFGSNWQTKLTLNSPAAAHPSISIGGSGKDTRAVLVWEGKGSGVHTIFATTKLIKGNWSSPRVISEYAHLAANPSVAVDQKGNALAIWYAYDYTDTDNFNTVVKFSTFSSSNRSWSDVTNASLPTLQNPEKLKTFVGLDVKGNASALWNQSCDGKIFGLCQGVKIANDDWTFIEMSDAESIYPCSADLSITSAGDVLVVYMAHKEGSLLIQADQSNFDSILDHGYQSTISEGKNNAYPKIAASSSGNVIHAAAVWITYNGIHRQIASSVGSSVQEQ